MESESAEDVRTLLAHEEASAGGVMTAACVEARPDQTAASVLDHIRAAVNDLEHINTVYVLDEARRLVGVVSLHEVFRSAPDARLDGIMTTHLVSVSPEASVRDVARLFVKYGFRAIPVLDDRGVFLGAVRQRRIIGELAPLLRE
jgi:magnesium transporter